MNAVSYILRILAVFGALGAGALFYLSKEKLAQQKADYDQKLSAAQAQASTAQSALEAAKEAQTAAEQKAAQDAARANEASGEIASYRAAAADSKSLLDAATRRMDTLQSDLDNLRSQLSAKDSNIALLTSQVRELQAAGAAPRPTAIATTTNGAITPSATAASGPAPADGPATTPVVSTPVATKILEISPKNGLIVLAGGGMENNSQLLLQLDGADLGKVLVSDSRPDFAVAIILEGTDIKKLKLNQELEYVRLR